MVLSAWPLVFWLVGFLVGRFLRQSFCCFFLSGSFLYTPCVLLETLALFCSIYYLLSIKKKKKRKDGVNNKPHDRKSFNQGVHEEIKEPQSPN